MTGRAFGFCAGFSAPGFANAAPGRGCRGFGFGRGGRGGGFRFFQQGTAFRRGFPLPGRVPGEWQPMDSVGSTGEDEVEYMKRELRTHEETIAELKRRIAELQDKPEP